MQTLYIDIFIAVATLAQISALPVTCHLHLGEAGVNGEKGGDHHVEAGEKGEKAGEATTTSISSVPS